MNLPGSTRCSPQFAATSFHIGLRQRTGPSAIIIIENWSPNNTRLSGSFIHFGPQRRCYLHTRRPGVRYSAELCKFSVSWLWSPAGLKACGRPGHRAGGSQGHGSSCEDGGVSSLCGQEDPIQVRFMVPSSGFWNQKPQVLLGHSGLGVDRRRMICLKTYIYMYLFEYVYIYM